MLFAIASTMPYLQLLTSHLRAHCHRTSAPEGWSQLRAHHHWWKFDQLPIRAHYTNSRYGFIKNHAEQRYQYAQHQIQQRWYQEYVCQNTSWLIWVHENATATDTWLYHQTLRTMQKGRWWLCLHGNQKRYVRPPISQHPCQETPQTPSGTARVTYACIVIDHWPQKDDPNCVRITIGGNLINYPYELTTQTADMVSSKIM